MRDRPAGVAKTPYSQSVAKTPDNKDKRYLIRGFGNTPEPARGGFSCPKYAPIPGSKRCQHYVGNGACALPDELMCIEWLKRNGHAAAPAALQAAVPAPRAVFPPPAPAQAPEQAGARGAHAGDLSPIELAIEHHGQRLFLVEQYSDSERGELSWDHAATLRLLLESFPGARLVGFGHAPPHSPAGEQP